MRKKILTLLPIAAIGFLMAMTTVHAATTPVLTLSAIGGGGDSVQVAVTGDANSTVTLFYNVGSSSGMSTANIGVTNGGGEFSDIISTSAQGINPGALVYVVVDGAQSAISTWPYTGSSGSSPVLSQSSVTVAPGQELTITSEGTSNPIFISTNSNPSVAAISINGTSIAITGENSGSTTATVCYQSSTSNCTSLSVTTSGSGSSALTFSQNNVSLATGQTLSISVSGGSGSGTYFISSNSNPSAIGASLSGSLVVLNAPGGSGSSTITVCSSTTSVCGTIIATANGSSSGSVIFSQSNPNIAIGQTTSVSLSGGSGSYYISSSATSIVQASISGNILNLDGLNSGSTSITVCSSTGGCSSLLVTVGSSSGSITFSQSNPVVPIGQDTILTIFGGSGTYSVSSNSNSSVAWPTINGDNLTLEGETGGSTTIVICSTSGGCGTLFVTVGSTSGSVIFSQNNPQVSIGQTLDVTLSGGSGSYYISSAPASSILQASINSNVLDLVGVNSGSTSMTVCSSSGGCSSLAVIVGGSSGSLSFSESTVSVTPGQSTSVSIFGNGSYYISGAQNSNIASVVINGSTATVQGIEDGTTDVTICQNSGSCNTLDITVGASSSSGTVSFSQSTISLTPGQTTNISIYGNGSYFVSGNQNSSVASVAVNGTTATVEGLTNGSTSATICQNSGGCGILNITVAGSGSAIITFSQTNPTITVGQTIDVSLTGGSGSYYLSSSPDNITQASISGSTLILDGLNPGSSAISVCSSGYGCSTFDDTVTSSATATGTTTETTTQLLAEIQSLQTQLAQLEAEVQGGGTGTGSSTYKFLNPLAVGSSGTDVTELQERLTTDGDYSGPITGYYGVLTEAGVERYQTQHGITPLGIVGPATRAALNSGE